MFLKKKYIFVKPIGGIGNQLFQFFFGLFVSIKSHRTLIISNKSFFFYRKRKPELNKLINNNYLSSHNLLNFFISFFPKKNFNDSDIFKVNNNLIDSIIDCQDSIVNLNGYWQSFNYLSNFKIKKILNFFSENIFSIGKKKYNFEKSVALHIRRGDFYDEPEVSIYHGILTDEYFRLAISFFLKIVSDFFLQ